MPLAFATWFRALLVALMAGYVFLMYGMARGMSGVVGLNLGTVLLSSLASLALTIPMVWIGGLPELPEIYVKHWRANSRWRRGECPECGYSVGSAVHAKCPECGRPVEAPPPYRFGRATIIRFGIMLVLAWVIGCGLGETWTRIDEIAFEREAAAAMNRSASDRYVRPRRWPGGGSHLVYDRGRGVITTSEPAAGSSRRR